MYKGRYVVGTTRQTCGDMTSPQVQDLVMLADKHNN